MIQRKLGAYKPAFGLRSTRKSYGTTLSTTSITDHQPAELMSLHASLASLQIGATTTRAELPSPEDFAPGSVLCETVCGASCEQSEGTCTGRLTSRGAQEHDQLMKGEDWVSWADMDARRSFQYRHSWIGQPHSPPRESRSGDMA
jgi:hypothetical protein